jgi:hypothetical protein
MTREETVNPSIEEFFVCSGSFNCSWEGIELIDVAGVLDRNRLIEAASVLASFASMTIWPIHCGTLTTLPRIGKHILTIRKNLTLLIRHRRFTSMSFAVLALRRFAPIGRLPLFGIEEHYYAKHPSDEWHHHHPYGLCHSRHDP